MCLKIVNLLLLIYVYIRVSEFVVCAFKIYFFNYYFVTWFSINLVGSC